MNIDYSNITIQVFSSEGKTISQLLEQHKSYFGILIC